MILETIPVGMLGCNCSVIGDEIIREAIVIDPGDDISRIQEILARHQLKVTTIAITHAHIDHIGGAHKLRALTGAPVYMHEADTMLSDRLDVQANWLGMETPENPGIDTPASEGDILARRRNRSPRDPYSGAYARELIAIPSSRKEGFRRRHFV